MKDVLGNPDTFMNSAMLVIMVGIHILFHRYRPPLINAITVTFTVFMSKSLHIGKINFSRISNELLRIIQTNV